MTDIVERLRRRRLPMDVGWLTIYEDDIECHEAADEIERLRAALRPFAGLFLYPDDLGFEASEDIKSEQDWDEDANDMVHQDCFVLRRDIRKARTALGEK